MYTYSANFVLVTPVAVCGSLKYMKMRTISTIYGREPVCSYCVLLSTLVSSTMYNIAQPCTTLVHWLLLMRTTILHTAYSHGLTTELLQYEPTLGGACDSSNSWRVILTCRHMRSFREFIYLKNGKMRKYLLLPWQFTNWWVNSTKFALYIVYIYILCPYTYHKIAPLLPDAVITYPCHNSAVSFTSW